MAKGRETDYQARVNAVRMMPLRVKSILFLWLLILGLPLALYPAHGQISALKKAVASEEPTKRKAPETPEEARKRLEQWQQEARDTLARIDAPGAEAGLPQGITAAEFDERRRDLEQIGSHGHPFHQEPHRRRRRSQRPSKTPAPKRRRGRASPRNLPIPSS